MICPKCHSTIQSVIDSRASGNTVRRRRVCLDCLTRFSTVEIPLEEYAVMQKLEGKITSLQEELEKWTDLKSTQKP